MARQHEYLAWVAGLLPNYCPSQGALMLAALGHGKPQPVAVIGIPGN